VEFGRESKLAVTWLPAGGQREDAAAADEDFQQGRVAVIKFCEHPGGGDRAGVELAVFPEMDPGEIAVTRVGKPAEQRVAEIDFAEHSIVGDAGLLEFDPVDSEQVGKGGAS